jgi:hypothetical protein
MEERKERSIGILLFIGIIIVLDCVYFFYLGYSFLYVDGYLQSFLSISPSSLIMWIDVILTLPSLFIIPIGFMKRKNWARLYAVMLLSWSAFGAILMTGEKLIRYLFFVMYMVLLVYLLMSSVKRYFIVQPSERVAEYQYGIYTLYSKLVQLKNGKKQVIYFFSKRDTKSGAPSIFPEGFSVEVSTRSGLPYLKKNRNKRLPIR